MGVVVSLLGCTVLYGKVRKMLRLAFAVVSGVARGLFLFTHYGVGRVSVTGLVEGLYILHHGELTAVGGRFFMLGTWRMLFLIWGGCRYDPDAWRPST